MGKIWHPFVLPYYQSSACRRKSYGFRMIQFFLFFSETSIHNYYGILSYPNCDKSFNDYFNTNFKRGGDSSVLRSSSPPLDTSVSISSISPPHSTVVNKFKHIILIKELGLIIICT